MNFAARIENTVWAMYPVELDKLRVRAASENSALESVIAKANLDNFQPEANPSSLATRSGERLAGTRYVSVRDEIAVIEIQGAMWTSGGWQAVKAGLADDIGDFESVVAGMRREIRKASRNSSVGAENEGDFDMGFKEDFKAFAVKHGLMADDKEPKNALENSAETEQEKPEAVAAPQSGETAEQRLAQAENELAQVKQEKLEADADGFISAEIGAGRMMSAEKDGFKSLYLQAAADDTTSPLATGSRLENLKAIQSKRKSSGLTEEQLDPQAGLLAVKPELSETAKLEASAEQQADDYVAQITPNKTTLKAVN